LDWEEVVEFHSGKRYGSGSADVVGREQGMVGMSDLLFANRGKMKIWHKPFQDKNSLFIAGNGVRV